MPIDKNFYEEIKALSEKYGMKIVTAKQPPYPEGYTRPPPSDVDFIFMDYITLMPANHIVKFTAPCGWEEQFSEFITDYCNQHNKMMFVDRAGVYKCPHGKNIAYYNPNDTLPGQHMPTNNFAWFAHRGMEDLPFTVEVPIPVEFL